MGIVTGIHHVCVKCSSAQKYEETKRFYIDLLEGKMIRQWASGCHIGLGDGIVEVFNNAECDLPQGAVRHFAVGCQDVDGCVNRLSENGYAITLQPKDIVIPAQEPYAARIAFAIGPNGEEIEIFDEK